MERRRRVNRLAAQLHPLHLFVTGVVLIACFLFQQNLPVRIGQVAVFAGLAILAGKRIRWGYFLIMVGSITVFNLLTPVGEVLLRAGPIVVTRGALRQGLMKGFAIPGLVFISLFAVAPDLRLPGRIGGMTARLFYYFELLLEGRKRIELKNFVSSVDNLLLDLLSTTAELDDREAASPGVSAENDHPMQPRRRSTPAGSVLSAVLAAASIAAAAVFGTY